MEKKIYIEALLDLLERRDYHALRAMAGGGKRGGRGGGSG